MAKKLADIAQGQWVTDKDTNKLKGGPLAKCPDLELWASKWFRGGRIVLEVAVDWSEKRQTFCEMLRLWVRPRATQCWPALTMRFRHLASTWISPLRLPYLRLHDVVNLLTRSALRCRASLNVRNTGRLIRLQNPTTNPPRCTHIRYWPLASTWTAL